MKAPTQADLILALGKQMLDSMEGSDVEKKLKMEEITRIMTPIVDAWVKQVTDAMAQLAVSVATMRTEYITGLRHATDLLNGVEVKPTFIDVFGKLPATLSPKVKKYLEQVPLDELE